MGRSTFRAIYDLIEKDLLEAIPVLPTKDKISEENIGRPSRAAAQALLARMYLFESSYAKNYPGDSRFEGLTQKWDKVLSYAEAVINSDLYKLVGIDGETYNTWRSPKTDGFTFIFTVEGDNSDESVFEIQSVYTGANYGLSRGSCMTQWTAARYCMLGTTKTATGYWGLGLPTQNLVDDFDRNDPRFKTTIAVPGDSIEISTGTFLMNFESAYTGYYDRKYECSADQFAKGQGSWDKSPLNVKIIRYGDVVLMAAEAAIMLNNNEKALKYINMIRTRARMCGNTGVPADLTGTVTMDQIIKERRVELALEGYRFFDLVRWNKAVERINGTETPSGLVINYESPKDDFMPLPAREISLSDGTLKQYPGW
jgi:starch-binding outer membrane protein, SusD/RagB family